MGENFRRKARFVAGGHTTEELVIIYLSVVLRDSVRIALTIAGLNGSTVEKNMGGRGSRVWIGGRNGIHHQECTEWLNDPVYPVFNGAQFNAPVWHIPLCKNLFLIKT